MCPYKIRRTPCLYFTLAQNPLLPTKLNLSVSCLRCVYIRWGSFPYFSWSPSTRLREHGFTRDLEKKVKYIYMAVLLLYMDSQRQFTLVTA